MTQPLNVQEMQIISKSPEDTERIGMTLGALLQAGDLVCLSGELGAGKTCLARGIARGWGAREHATSPTFALINLYHREVDAQRLYHVDAYRLRGAADAVTTGLEDVLESEDVVIIEWPERIRAILPAEYLWVSLIDSGGSERALIVSAHGVRASALLDALSADTT